MSNLIDQEVKKFDVVESNLTQLAEAGRSLTIAANGAEAVRKARIALKNERVRIEKKGKELRDEANKFNKAVLAKEKEYLAIITPVEDALEAQEKAVAAEAARIEAERKAAELAKVTSRINDLSKFGYTIDFSRASSLTDDQFTQELAEAEASYNQEQARLLGEKEAQRIEAERLASERAAFEAEQAKAKAESDRIAKEQADKQREIELAQQKIRLEQEAVERERRQQVEHEVQMKAQAERAEKQRQEAIEAERKRLAQEQAIKAEQEKQAAIAAKREADMAPDKDKLSALSLSFKNYELPALSMPEAAAVTASVRGLLDKVSAYIDSQISKL
jgi:hypothetical protein